MIHSDIETTHSDIETIDQSLILIWFVDHLERSLSNKQQSSFVLFIRPASFCIFLSLTVNSKSLWRVRFVCVSSKIRVFFRICVFSLNRLCASGLRSATITPSLQSSNPLFCLFHKLASYTLFGLHPLFASLSSATMKSAASNFYCLQLQIQTSSFLSFLSPHFG